MTADPVPLIDRPAAHATTLPSWLVRPPGLLFWLATTFAIFLALDANSLQSFANALFAQLLWAILALIWVIRFATASFDRRLRLRPSEWLRWLAIPAVFGLVFLVTRTDIPQEVRFALSREQLDRRAVEVMDGGATGDGWVGLYPAKGIERIPNGMRFRIEGGGFIDRLGLAYSTEGRPPNVDGLSRYKRIEGNWWIWIAEF